MNPSKNYAWDISLFLLFVFSFYINLTLSRSDSIVTFITTLIYIIAWVLYVLVGDCLQFKFSRCFFFIYFACIALLYLVDKFPYPVVASRVLMGLYFILALPFAGCAYSRLPDNFLVIFFVSVGLLAIGIFKCLYARFQVKK